MHPFFQDDWLPLDDTRVVRFVNDGKVIVIKPTDKTSIVPLFCPMCNLPMQTSADALAFRKTGGCNLCNMNWCYPYSKQWADGWRPWISSPERWTDYLERRVASSKPEIVFG